MASPTTPKPTTSKPTPAGTDVSPQPFGRYLLLDHIGKGGMADVFRAVTGGSQGFRRLLVVKRIRVELSSSESFIRMFGDEARISALLNHPNIVQVYDFGQIDQSYFMVMEYLDGKDLKVVLSALRAAGAVMPPPLAAMIAHQAATALHHAHTLVNAEGRPFDIIHRDVNPSNIMLLRTGTVKLLDFGIAKASDAIGKTQTRHTVLKGKLSYMSPEQVRCTKLDARSDIFSLGVTLWEMLTGKRLFRGPTDYDRVQNVLSAPIEPPSARREGVPVALDRIVMRALARDADKRYATAEDMANDLEVAMHEEPTDSHAISRLLADLFGSKATGNTVDMPVIPDGADTPVPDSDADTGSRRTKVETGSRSMSSASHGHLAPWSRRSGGARILGTGTASAVVTPPPAAPKPVAGAVRVAWLVGGAIAAAVLLVGVSLGWAPGRSPAASLAGGGALSSSEARASASGAAAGLIKIDLDSSPSGAAVYGPTGIVGTTPVTLTLALTAMPVTVQLKHPGYQDLDTEIASKSGGVLFFELTRR